MATPVTTTTALNLRTGPGTSADVILTIPKGGEVALNGAASNGWYPVEYKLRVGWVSGKYLTGLPEPGLSRGVLLDAMLAQLGKPYRWGGNGPDNFDCSGYVGYIWRQLGIRDGDYTADAMYDNLRLGKWPGQKVAVEEADLGDLVFFGSGTNAGHVVFALSPGHVIGATGGGVSTTTYIKAKQQGASVRIDLMGKVGSHSAKDRLAVIRMPLELED